MRPKYLGYKRLARFLSFSILCLLLYTSSAGIALGQKEPKSLKLDTSTDDRQLCSKDKKDSQFCFYYNQYNSSSATAEVKTAARNEMIDLLVGQIDTYYKMRKDGRKGRIRFLQTFLDFLDVAATTAVAIVSGERVKTIIGAASTGFRGGRTSFEKNFQILQTQVLINKMNANRALVQEEIFEAQKNGADEYGWYAAKNDLRRYLYAGTFNNALDTLVIETGSAAVEAEKALELKKVEKRSLAREATTEQIVSSQDYSKTIKKLELQLDSGVLSDVNKATGRLQAIVTKVLADSELKSIWSQIPAPPITGQSNGKEVLRGLLDLKDKIDDLDTELAEKLTARVNSIVISEGAN